MPDDISPDDISPDDISPDEQKPVDESDWQRRRRLAAIFGDVLPDTTSDERDRSVPSEDSSSEAWLKAQVPPHHGG